MHEGTHFEVGCPGCDDKVKAEEKQIRPFSSGSHLEWQEGYNCNRCIKSYFNTNENLCDLDEAISLAYIGSGEITESQARRIGLVDGKHEGCTEKVLPG